jgi:hypothetical protein
VKFVNETEHSLGRGVCTVYDTGVYAGSCVVAPCKPGEEQILPHALETGVKVENMDTKFSDDFMSLKISQGVGVTITRKMMVTEYRIKNSKDEEFKLIFDYDHHFGRGGEKKVKVTLNGQELHATKEKDSHRITFPVTANGTYELRIEEMNILESKTKMDSGLAMGWFDTNIIRRKLPVGESSLKEAIDLRKKMDEIEEEIKKLQGQREMRIEEQKRAIMLLESDPSNEAWKKDLATSEDEIRKIDRVGIPTLEQTREETLEKFYTALKTIAYEWAN